MPTSSTAFHAVYHVTAINHWRLILDEQLAILFRNRNLKSVTITIAAGSDHEFAAVKDGVWRAIVKWGVSIPVTGQASSLDQFEHGAIMLVDRLAKSDDIPILYFHMKGVSCSPPQPLWETWRRRMNHLIADADRWADFLVQGRCDACGSLLTLDPDHGFAYFAGNFWLANASYLRSLPSYAEFIENPGTPYFVPFDRHLAEVAVNRARHMNAFAIDGTFLTPRAVFEVLRA